MGGTSTDVCLVRGRVPRAHGGARRRRLPDPAPRARRAHDRRGRWFDRAARCGRRACGRSAERGRGSRSGVLRTRWHRTDRHRRRSVARPHPGRRRTREISVGSTSPRHAPRSSAPVSNAEGVVAVVDAAMEQAVRVVTVERGVDPRDLALVAFGGAGPLHACAIADALGMRAVVIPPRAGVCSAVGLLCAPKAREVVHIVRRRFAERRARTRRRATCDHSSARAASSRRSVDCRYVGQSHELTRSIRWTIFRPSTSGATVTRGPARRSRSSRCAPGRRSRRRCASPTCPPSIAARVVGPAVVAEARLHGVGSRGLARRAASARRVGRGAAMNGRDSTPRRCRCGSRGSPASPTRWARCCAAPRTARTSRSAPTVRARCSRPTARCSRRPSTSRCISDRCRRRGARRDRRLRRRRCSPASRSSSTIRSRAGRISTTSRSSRPCTTTTATLARLGREPRPSRRHRRHGAGFDAARRDRDLPRRAAHPAGAVDAGGRGACSSPRRARPTNGAAISTRNSARTGSASRASARAPLATAPDVVRRDRRLRRAPHARRDRRAVPDGEYAFDDVLDSTGGPGRSAAGAHPRSRSRSRGDVDHVRLHRYRRATRGLGQRGRSRDASARSCSRCGRSSIPTFPRTVARCGPCACSRRRVRSSPRSCRSRSAAGNVEVSQRVADVCLGALAQAAPDRVGARVAGHDEQRARRRRRAGCTTRRSAAGRAAGPTGRPA